MFRRHVTRRFRRWVRRVRRFLVFTVLHADDPPHRLALGAAIGVFVAFTPTFGIQMGIVVFAAWLLRANKAVGVPFVWISNPATMVPIYYGCYFVGKSLLRIPPKGPDWWNALSHPPDGWLRAFEFYWTRILQIATPLWLGGCFVGLITAIPTYYLFYHGIRIYRSRRHRGADPPATETAARLGVAKEGTP